MAQYATEKVIELGGKVVTLSDSSGSIYDPKGLNTEKLQWAMDLKNNKRGRIKGIHRKVWWRVLGRQTPMGSQM